MGDRVKNTTSFNTVKINTVKINTAKFIMALTLCIDPNAAFAVEDCTLARAMNYKLGASYSNIVSQDGIANSLMSDTNARLFRRGNSVPIINELAKEVIIDENTHLMIIKLRKNCGWSDGHIITADQMLRGIQNTYLEGSKSSNIGRQFIHNGPDIINGTKDISELGAFVINEFELGIEMGTSGDLMQQFLMRYNYAPFPTHLSLAAQEKWARGDFDRLSSGPYQAININEEKINMEKNPYFCTDLQPEIEHAIIYRQTDPTSQTGLFFNDTINIAERFDDRSLRSFQSRGKIKSFKIREINNQISVRLLQSEATAQSMPRPIKEAMFLALDRSAFSQLSVLERGIPDRKIGLADPHPKYDVPDNSLFADSYEERTAIARQRMSDAGYSAEHPYELKLLVLNSWDTSQITSGLRSMWAQIYVDLNVSHIDFSQFSWKALEEWPNGYDYLLLSSEAEYSDPIDALSSLVEHGAVKNRDQLRQKISASFKIFDSQRRMNALQTIEKELQQNQTMLTLFATSTPWVIDDGLELKDYFYLTTQNISSKSCPK